MIIGGKKEEAFTIASTSDCMNIYIETLGTSSLFSIGNSITIEEFLKISQYFEGKNKYGEAANYY